MQALVLHKSQMHPYGKKTLAEMFKLLIAFRSLRYGLRRLALRAEAFRVVNLHAAHCTPEFCEKSLFGKY